MSEPEHKAVFLSYASQDAEAAKKICDALRAAGIEVWFDQNELVGGDAWDAKIRKQIAECALFVPIISANTQARLEGYFRIEWKLAARRTHAMATAKAFLLPVVIDATRDAEAHVPDEFRDVQWTRLPGGEAAEKFCARVRTLLGGSELEPGSPRPGERGEGAASPALAATRSPRLAWLGAGLMILAVIAFVFRGQLKVPADGVASSETRTDSGEVTRLLAQIAAIVDKQADATRDDWLLAESLGANLVKTDPGNAAGWAAYAEAALGLYEYFYDRERTPLVDARKRAQQALTLAPESLDAQLALANSLRYLPDTRAEAEEMLRKIVERRPDENRALRSLADLLRAKLGEGDNQDQSFLANTEAAITLYDRAASRPGGDPVALRGKALTLMGAGRYAEADATLDASAALRPGPSAAALKLWSLLLLHDDVTGACDYASKLPGTYLLREHVVEPAAYAWLWKGEPERGLRILSGWNEDWLFDTPKALLTGFALQQLGRLDAAKIAWGSALKVVEAAIETRTREFSRAGALSHKARLHALRGEREQAEEAMRLYTQLTTNLSPIRRAWIYVPLGRLDEAMDAIVAAEVGRRARVRFDGRSADLLIRASLRHDALWNPLRRDPRFVDVVRAARAPLQPISESPAAQSQAPEKSVAVLAFKNLSGDPAREFFSDGLSEAVTDVLGRVPGLKVVGSASAFSFKGKSVPIPEIARQLGVTHLVEGTVIQDGQTVRITAKLIQADGFQVWVSDKLDRELKNIFALHDEVAGLIAKNLSLKLGVAAGRPRREIDPEAYQLYMQARQAWSLRNSESLTRAEGMLDRALKLEPDYAQAHVALADVWIARSGQAGAFGTFEHRQSPEKARIMAKIEHALRLDPDSAEARASLGAVAWYDWDFTTAERELRSAIALNPNYAPAHAWLGRALQSQGRTDEALAALRLAAETDPLSPVVLANYCGRLVEAGRVTEALAVADRGLVLQPDSRPLLMHKAHALLDLGRLPEAVVVARQLVATGPSDPNNLFPAVFIIAGAGATAEATTMMAALPAWGRLPRSALLLALGRRDEAIAALDAPGQNVNFLGYVLYDRRYDSIRGEPRFVKYLADLGLTEAHARAQAWRAAHPAEKPVTKQ